MNKNVKVVLVDDHVLVRNGLAEVVRKLGYSVLFEGCNGKELTEKIDKNNLPNIILMDISMPEMDGFEATLWLTKNYPLVNVLALSMYEDEITIIRMLKNGAKGYVLKDCETSELKQAIDSIISKGFYYSEMVTGRLVHTIREIDEEDNSTKQILNLGEKEIEFLKLACTEMTYKEIAEQMYVSARTIDGYRDVLFEKLNVKSRVGLVLFAIKNRIVQIN